MEYDYYVRSTCCTRINASPEEGILHVIKKKRKKKNRYQTFSVFFIDLFHRFPDD